ncbi:MAG: hypothetical protein LRS49_06390 [Desulfurococcales archaeon]|nr:hypothetical protein [Desulfurococcales archaeon]
MSGDLEERLSRIERLLEEAIERLARLERLTLEAGGEARLAAELALAFTRPVQEVLDAAARAARALSRLAGPGGWEPDGVTKAIVEALAVRGPLTLRGLEREVRRIRGTASRRVIRSRLEELERAGVVRVERRGRRLVVRLATD